MIEDISGGGSRLDSVRGNQGSGTRQSKTGRAHEEMSEPGRHFRAGNGRDVGDTAEP